MTRVDETDVALVGLGAAGSIAALVLTRAGVNVIALEAGPFFRQEEFDADELRSAEGRNELGRKFNAERPVWRPHSRSGPSRRPLAAIGQMMNGVGGSTVHYGGWSRRFFPSDFHALTTVIERYGEEAVPAGSTLVDWPINYEDLEPYYGRVEQLLGVSGVAAKVRGRERNPTGNPFEGERSCDYPLPPLRPFPLGDLFAQSARSLGWHPYPMPAAVLSQDYQGRSACTYCGWCAGYGCRIGAKSSALVTAVPAALASGLLTVRSESRATEILCEGNRIVGVRCLGNDASPFEIRARIVVLAAYTYENVRLLLLSRSKAFPSGIGNLHGRVGKDFMSRDFIGVCGVIPGARLDRFAGPVAQAVCVDDFNDDFFDHSGLGFIRGGTISVENQLQPLAAATVHPPSVGSWGRKYKEYLVDGWNSVAVVRGQPEPLPWVGNELDLDPVSVEDGALRLPRVRITYQHRQNEERLSSFLLDRIEEVVRAMGAIETWRLERDPARVLSGHDVGGTRMGNEPSSSVVDEFGAVHEAEGLVLLGGSTFPTNPGANPTLTIQALAWRSAERLAAALGRPLPSLSSGA